MITPSPQVDKTFDPPLAARPMPIRTGSLAPTSSSPARNRDRLRQATSLLRMRGLSHFRSLTMSQKGSGSFSWGSSSGSSSSSGGSSSSSATGRKGTTRSPTVVGMSFFDGGDGRGTVAINLPPRACAVRTDGLPMSVPALKPRVSISRIPFLGRDEFGKIQARDSSRPQRIEAQQALDREYASSTSDILSEQPDSISSAGNSNALHLTAKRNGGVELWDVALDIDQDALRDALDDHPDPLSSNPTSDHGEDESATAWNPAPFTPKIWSGTDDFNPYWQEVSTPCSKRRPIPNAFAGLPTRMTGEPDTPSGSFSTQNQTPDSCACGGVHPQLHREIANLRAGNSALLTLKAAYEETITRLYHKIERHDSAIGKLIQQVEAKETEQMSIVENFCAETSSQNQEIDSLKEDKWYLMGEIAQLEKKMATFDDAVGFEKMQGTRGELVSHGVAEFGVGSFQAHEHDDNGASLAGTSLSPSVHEASSTQTFVAPDSQDGRVKRRNRESGHSRPTDVSREHAGSSGDHPARHTRGSQTMAAQIVLAAKVKMEQDLHMIQEKLAVAEARSQELQVQLASQATLFQQMARASTEPTPAYSAQILVPDLPVLTYTTPSAAWNERVLTSFKYLGLLDFIQRDIPRPETSTWDATEVADWTSRRLRAAVLLKQAMDDDILEDVLYVHETRETAPGQQELDGPTPCLEDPHQLFTTIACLHRIISPSAIDGSWLDRIKDTDFDGIEGFTSLVLCIDKRHGVMYGASANYYHALLLKLQETMARLFPELKGSTFAVDLVGSLPGKWRQLSIWMTKVVLRRQISEDW